MKKLTFLLLLLLLPVTSFACAISAGGPQLEETIPVSTEAAGTLQQSLDALDQSGLSDAFAVTVTEEQITSYLSLQLSADSSIPISNPQVRLRDNQIQLYGTVTRGIFSANVRVNLAAQLDAEGNLSFLLVDADFGNIPAPDSLKNTVSSILDTGLNSYLTELAAGIRIENVYIADGLMTISGIRR